MRKFIRRNVESLEAYSPEPQSAAVVVNANENPYNLPEDIRKELADKIMALDFNRYPDPRAHELVSKIANAYQVNPDGVLVGSGLDEVLSILTETFVGPNDTVVSHLPGFSMYEIWTDVADGRFIGIPDREDHTIDVDGIIEAANDNAAKIIYLCRPNNPTGYLLPREEVVRILENTNSLVVLDEAYIDFAKDSLMDLLPQYENLVVLRTFSKACALPAARCGFMVADPRIIDSVMKVKAPYNLNTLTQTAAGVVLDHLDEVLAKVDDIVEGRDDLYDFLTAYPSLDVLPSAANFLYVYSKDAPELASCFKDLGVLPKYFKDEDAFRITVGTPVENRQIKKAVISLYGEADG